MPGKKTAPITEVLSRAIQAESDGYHFYMMAAKSTEDPLGREMFTTLANEEAAHVRFLRTQYQAFVDRGEPDATVRLGKGIKLAKTDPLFSPALRQRVTQAHYEMSALAIGIQLELSSKTFYENESKRAKNPVVKKFFAELADWESGHYDALLAQHQALKQDYWAAGGFSPF
jgi:rubrerythrin